MLRELVVVLFLFFVFTPIGIMAIEIIRDWQRIRHRRGGRND